MLRVFELAIVVLALLSPFYYCASNLRDLSEARSTALGILQASVIGGIISVYKIWKESNKICPDCGKRMKNCICK